MDHLGRLLWALFITFMICHLLPVLLLVYLVNDNNLMCTQVILLKLLKINFRYVVLLDILLQMLPGRKNKTCILAGHLDQFYIQFQIILSNNKETAVELSTSHNLF